MRAWLVQTLSDDLVRTDAIVEGVLRKIERQYNDSAPPQMGGATVSDSVLLVHGGAVTSWQTHHRTRAHTLSPSPRPRISTGC